jgi:hypothetical protein
MIGKKSCNSLVEEGEDECRSDSGILTWMFKQ